MAQTPIAVFASGRGTNFEALARAAADAKIPAEIRLLIVNVPDAPVLARAHAHHIPAVVINHRDFGSRPAFEAALLEKLKPHGVELVCLAGFNRILSPFFISAYRYRVMNIHPSLLPAFAGLQGRSVHEAVLAAGVKVTGCTVHFVTEEIDAGPIILQRTTLVHDDDTPDTLAARVLVEEHQAYPEAVRLFCERRLVVHGRRVRILNP